MNTTEIGIGGNREHKDTLFRKIFGAEEHKHYLLSLYNAINHSEYTNVDDLQYKCEKPTPLGVGGKHYLF